MDKILQELENQFMQIEKENVILKNKIKNYREELRSLKIETSNSMFNSGYDLGIKESIKKLDEWFTLENKEK